MASPAATREVAAILRPVAALYIDPRGPYPAMPEVDAWDETRDAKKYAGPFPVVAHPPCGPWGQLHHMCWKQDPECAIRAVDQVRAFGGVLEHPKYSKLWAARSLPLPGASEDQWGGFTVQVDQCAWGHVARKTTWLYIVGLARGVVEAAVLRGGEPTHWVSGARRPHYGGGAVPAGIKICSAEQRRRTPPAFAEWLVSIARAVTL